MPRLTPQGPEARFAAGLARLWPEGNDPAARLGLAVSGGPDSLALLLLAQAARPGRIAAATVDHGLRPESAAEAAMVAKVCAGLGVAHATLRVVLSAGNLSAAARRGRYAALAEWAAQAGLAALATAHHADDQAETLLLRLNRASGVSGLAGVRARGPLPGGGLVLRPLLGWRRTELATVVTAAGLIAADDPTNHDPAFDRARLRAHLASADWLDVPALAASASHLADADAALDWAAAREWRESVRREGLGVCYRPQAPRAVGLRVIARIVDDLAGGAVRGGQIAQAFDALVAGRTVSLDDLVARPTATGWCFAKAPSRRAALAKPKADRSP